MSDPRGPRLAIPLSGLALLAAMASGTSAAAAAPATVSDLADASRYRRHGGARTLLHAPEHPEERRVEPSLEGRWECRQPPDVEGEVLELSVSSGRWRGVLNGLERAGEHGLFYYAVEVESLEVSPDGWVRFMVGERRLFHRRPDRSILDGAGDAGVVRDRMRFTGRIEDGDLILRCVGWSAACPDSTLRFKRRSRPPEPGP